MNSSENARPIMPIRSTSRVTVWRGKVFVAPLGYTTMGVDSENRLIASNGTDVVEMVEIGTVFDNE